MSENAKTGAGAPNPERQGLKRYAGASPGDGHSAPGHRAWQP